MWSLYRCPHCQGISTGKQWLNSTVSHTGENVQINLHHPKIELICPVCGKKVANGKLIMLWDFWNRAS